MTTLAAQILAVLPQTQCTRCGYRDCAAYAQAVDSCSNLGSGAPEVEEAIALAHEGGVS